MRQLLRYQEAGPEWHLSGAPELFHTNLPYLGRSMRMFVHPSAGRDVTIRFHHWQFDVDVPRRLTGDGRRERIRAAFEGWYRRRAEDRLLEHVARVARLLGVGPSAVLVRDQRQRCASCLPNGAFRSNWRALMAPPALLDYVIAHEHLRVSAHTPQYWAVVRRPSRTTGRGASGFGRSALC